MYIAILVLSIISPIVTLLVLGFIVYKVYGFETKFPTILGEKIRISKAQGSKIQQKMNDLMELDITNYVNENPMLLEIFPESISHMEVTRGQPQFINSLISTFAPALGSVLMNSGSDRNQMSNNVAASVLSNPNAMTGLVQIFQQIRESAKKSYVQKTPKEIATTSSTSSAGSPKAEGY